MRVLHLTSSLGIGGAEAILFNLVQDQSEKDIEYFVFSLFGEEYYNERLIRAGIKTRSFRFARDGFLAPCNWGRQAKELLALITACKKVNPDVIHSWMYPADLMGGIVGKIVRVPVVWGIFSGHVDKHMYKKKTYALLRLCGIFASRLPARVISCSSFGRRTHATIGYPKEKIFFVPTGFVDHALVNTNNVTTGYRANRQSEGVVVGMLARFSIEKDFETLLSALRLMVLRGVSVEVRLAGGIGIDQSNLLLAKWIKDRDLTRHVKLLGRIEETGKFFRDLDIFCLISKSEGFPTVVGEAMLAQLPCVVSDIGDSKILLNDYRQITGSRGEQVADRLIQFAQMTVRERAQFGARNRARVLKHFSCQKMNARYSLLYRHLLQSQ